MQETPIQPTKAVPSEPLAGSTVPAWRRWLPLALLLVVAMGGVALGAAHLFDFDALALNYARLAAWVEANPLVSVATAVLVYTLATALSVPAGWVMTVTVGLLFGWQLGSIIALFSATVGASLLFLAARSALSPMFARFAAPWADRLAEGFRNDAASYLLFLRLAPIIPFSVVNIVPALFAVPLVTFVWTTLVGIIPGTAAYVTAGSGLRELVVERAEACAAGRPPCGTAIGPSDFLNPQILVALLLLAIVALVPVLWRRLRPARGQGPST
jgi:uncharacterized membrane protein YdjX (TVP38/TMEM64 family)